MGLKTYGDTVFSMRNKLLVDVRYLYENIIVKSYLF